MLYWNHNWMQKFMKFLLKFDEILPKEEKENEKKKEKIFAKILNFERCKGLQIL